METNTEYNLPKKWLESRCASCKCWWLFPVDEDWEWECDSDAVAPRYLVPSDEDCEGYTFVYRRITPDR